MIHQSWSWLLTIVGLTGLWFAGRDRPAGWLICVGLQGLWITYGTATEQWGFVIGGCAYGIVNSRNWYLCWKRRKNTKNVNKTESEGESGNRRHGCNCDDPAAGRTRWPTGAGD